MSANMRMIKLSLPLMTFALCLATASAAVCFGQDLERSRDASRRDRVVATGRLIGTRELQQVVTSQIGGAAYLAVQTASPRPRVLWRADAGNSQSTVDSVRISDLDADGIPEILSLWRKGGVASGAAIRVFHWDRAQGSFAELRMEGEINDVRAYRVASPRGRGSSSRLLVETRSGNNAGRSATRGVEYELRGSTLVRVGGGRIVTSQSESGIEGQAVISPARPGPTRQGISNTAPYKTTLVVWSAEGGREITSFETGSDGRFRVALPPGTYRVGPPHRAGRFLPRGTEETVTVAPGRFVQVTISFDSGMR